MQDSEEYPAEITILGYVPFCPSMDLENPILNESNSADSSGPEKAHRSSLTIILYKDDLTKIKEFQQPDPELLKEKFVHLGPKTKKYTLFLDLDNTLVYTEMIRNTLTKNDQYMLNVKIRPFAKELIQEMSDLYEICIFTAASEEYANEIINELDPNKKIKRIISRKHCVEIKEGYAVKDLRIFADRDLKDELIVDDSIYSFSFQIENGIPLKTYEGEEDDKELSLLIKYLKGLYDENPENLSELNKNKLWMGL